MLHTTGVSCARYEVSCKSGILIFWICVSKVYIFQVPDCPPVCQVFNASVKLTSAPTYCTNIMAFGSYVNLESESVGQFMDHCGKNVSIRHCKVYKIKIKIEVTMKITSFKVHWLLAFGFTLKSIWVNYLTYRLTSGKSKGGPCAVGLILRKCWLRG